VSVLTTYASAGGLSGLAVDAAGNVYLGVTQLVRVTPNGTATVVAAGFVAVEHQAVDAAGSVYLSDSGANSGRGGDPGGAVSVLAGSGAPGAADGAGASATFSSLMGVAVDAAGHVLRGWARPAQNQPQRHRQHPRGQRGVGRRGGRGGVRLRGHLQLATR
jgi:hypothetical protein